MGRRKDAAYQRFFEALLTELREEHGFTRRRKAQPKYWCLLSSEKHGLM